MAVEQFKNINLDVLKNLRGAKQQYGQAKTDEERQRASALGDSIRSLAGIKAGSQGLLSLPQLDELIQSREVVSPVETTEIASPVSTEEIVSPVDLRKQITDATKQRTVNALQNQFASTQSGLQAERAKLDPMFRTATGQVRTQDTMDRARADKMQMTQGLSASGAANQTDIAQNVITGGQLSGLKEQKIGLESDINRRLQEAQALRDRGIATADIDSNIAQMQNELAALEQQEALSREDAKVAEQQARLDFGNKVLANYNDLQGFANRLVEQGAPQWQIDQVLAARTQKTMEQGLDPVTGQPLPRDTTPELSTSAAMGLWEQIGVANEAISRALGIDPGTRFTRQAVASSGGGGLSAASIASLAKWKFDNGVPLNEQEALILGVDPGYTAPPTSGGSTTPTITKMIDNFIDSKVTGGAEQRQQQIAQLEQQFESIPVTNIAERLRVAREIENLSEQSNQPMTQAQKKDAVTSWIISNIDSFQDENQLMEVARLYQISEEDLRNRKNQMQNIPPSVGF